MGHRLEDGAHDLADGIFADWVWNGECLRVRTDRYGLSPLYYSATADSVAISPDILSLFKLGVATELDETSFGVFLLLGFYLADDTPFRAIKAVPPCATLTWRPGELRVTGERVRAKPQAITREAALDAYIELFREAVRRRVPLGEDFTVPLSGGRDSRHILLELCALGRPPLFCVTYGSFGSLNAEVDVAAKLCAALRVPHVVLHQPGSHFDQEYQKNLQTGFCTDEHAQTLVLRAYLNGRVRTLYDGIGGDVLSAGLFLDDERQGLLEAGRFEALARILARESRAIPGLLREEQRSRFDPEVAIGRIARELTDHAAEPNPIGSFFFWNRTRREIALSVYGVDDFGVPQCFAPYLDHRVYDLLASLPARLLMDHTFHTEAIRRAHPRYAAIPFSTGRSGSSRMVRTWRSQHFPFPLLRSLSRWRDPRRVAQTLSDRRFAAELLRYLLSGTYHLVDRQAAARYLLRWLIVGQTPRKKIVPCLLQLDRFLGPSSSRPKS
jgi:asparagine synthetase B (glutamine-hydrolysing)